MTAHRPTRPPFYLTAVCGLTLVLWLLPIALLRLPAWERWDQTHFTPLLDSSYTASGIDADIVVFGDSSALYGFDPQAMAATLGLRVLNLPGSIGSLQINRDRGLQTYLAHNKPPTLIVFYLAPWDLDYGHISPSSELYEAEEILLRHGSVLEILRFAAAHPRDALLLPLRFYHVHHPSAVLRGMRHPTPPFLAATMGHLDFNQPAIPPNCTLPAQFLSDAVTTTSVRTLLTRYNTPHTRAIVYIAPVPACANAASLRHPYPEISAAPPVVLPPTAFADDGHYAHLQATAVPIATQAFTDALAAVLNSHVSTTLSGTEQPIPIPISPANSHVTITP